MDGPEVSVVLPTYNSAGLVGQAVESILRQTYRPLEIVVIDDGSTDNTRQVVAAFGGRVRYVHQDNAGVAAARNHGVREARGEYIALQDADDASEPTRIALQMKLLAEDEQLGMVATGSCIVEGESPDRRERDDGGLLAKLRRLGPALGRETAAGLVFTEEAYKVLLEACFFAPATLVMKKDLVLRAGAFDPALKRASDYDFVLRAALLCRIGYVPQPLYVIRRGLPDGLHSDRCEASECIITALEKVERDWRPEDRNVREMINEKIAGKHTMIAGFLARRGDIRGARDHVAASLRRVLRPVPLAFFLASSLGPPGRPVVKMLTRRILRNEPQ